MRQVIPISRLRENVGQIEGLPKNPRIIKDDRFEALKKSITDDPEMLDLRELIVYPINGEYVVIGGNMRLAAMRELGYDQAPCKVLSKNTPVEKLRAYTIKDNIPFGENDNDALKNEWDIEELKDFGFDLNIHDDGYFQKIGKGLQESNEQFMAQKAQWPITIVVNEKDFLKWQAIKSQIGIDDDLECFINLIKKL